MKNLSIRYQDLPIGSKNYYTLHQAFDDLPIHYLSEATWEAEYPNRPQVEFQIMYTAEALYIHYMVKEDFVKARYVRPNEAVWEDSCIEFFVSFDNRNTYYNIEMNPFGTGLIGYGTANKDVRNRLSSDTVKKINAYTEVKSINGKKEWNTVLEIPYVVFERESALSATSLKGKTLQANFYKCGDELPAPHFLSWNRVDFPTPNFHLPEFFGNITFD